MKKLACAVFALLTGSMMLFTGCGSATAFDYDLSEYVKVGTYEGLTYDKPEKIKISQKDIEAKVKEDLEAAKYLKDVKDGKVHDGDTVNIDYEGTIDGKAFEGGTAAGQTLVIGSNSFIEGFESGLIGEKVGSKVSLDLTFPKDYGKEELQGKDVTFEVKINASQNYVTPSEKKYVKDSGVYKSVKEYEKAVKEELYNTEKTEQIMGIQQSLWNKVMDKSEMLKTPDKEIKAYVEQMNAQVQEYADSNNMEVADVLKNYYQLDEEAFNQQVQEAAEKNCFEQMVVYAIAREQKLEVTDDEYEKFVETQLANTGYSAKEFKEYTGKTYEEYVGGEDYIRYYLHYEKVIDYIMDKAKEK